MIRIFNIIFIIIILSGCSLKKDSKFWSASKKIDQDDNIKQKENKIEPVFNEVQVLNKEFIFVLLYNIMTMEVAISIYIVTKIINSSMTKILLNTEFC